MSWASDKSWPKWTLPCWSNLLTRPGAMWFFCYVEDTTAAAVPSPDYLHLVCNYSRLFLSSLKVIIKKRGLKWCQRGMIFFSKVHFNNILPARRGSFNYMTKMFFFLTFNIIYVIVFGFFSLQCARKTLTHRENMYIGRPEPRFEPRIFIDSEADVLTTRSSCNATALF